MPISKSCLGLLLGLFLSQSVHAVSLATQDPTPVPVEVRILNEIRSNGKAMADLEYLSDSIGPRLTGSANLATAQKWAAEKMKAYGAKNVHLESYIFPSRWERANYDYAQLLTQGKRQMTVHAMAWNPATKGMITTDLAVVQGKIDDLIQNIQQFKGKTVVMGQVAFSANESNAQQKMKQLNTLLGKQVTAMLVSYEHDDGKFTMYGSPEDWYFTDYFDALPRVPIGFLTTEDNGMLVRLLTRKEKVQMKLRLGGKITAKNVTEHNVVGEIPGAEKPDEIVIVGGHLDSWDLGTGTTDNGTGSIATLETLRVLNTLGIKPKRTIRFVLFSGEEQGSQGAKAYIKAHRDELSRYQAVLIHDVGAGKPTGFTVQGYKVWSPFLAEVLKPLRMIDVKPSPLSTHWDSDQDPFIEAGVPGFFLDQDIKDYFASTHHSQTDMFNHVKPGEYLKSVYAFAVASLGFANLADRVPHVKPGNVVGPDKD